MTVETEMIPGMLTESELLEFQDYARLFVDRSLNSMFTEENSDGNLTLIPALFQTATDHGLVPATGFIREDPGYGIWSDHPARLQLTETLLKTIAETCGGFATLLHWQGLVAMIHDFFLLEQPAIDPAQLKQASLCFQETQGLPSLSEIQHPTTAEDSCQAQKVGEGFLLNGHKSFVYTLPGTTLLSVFAPFKNDWALLLVPLDAAGVKQVSIGQRIGLRACEVQHFEFSDVFIPNQSALFGETVKDKLIEVIACNFFGLSAVACGVATGAYTQAKNYAKERYQGGALIQEHDVVRTLLTNSQSSIYAAEAMLAKATKAQPDLSLLNQTAMCKLKCLEQTNQAVTQALQVFGGYGYMEDYGIEKKFRDISALKVTYGAPTYLRQLIFETEAQI